MSVDSNRAGRRARARAFSALAILALLTGFLFWTNPENLYLWIKAVHVMAVIAWMAGMFYLPRLFVYHADVPIGSDQSELFKVMEKRLLTVIINPAMTFAWVLGLWMAWDAFGFRGGWLHMKLLAVVAMSAFHGYLAKAVRAFENDQNVKSARHWRIVNEIPTVLMIIIVIMVVVKPF